MEGEGNQLINESRLGLPQPKIFGYTCLEEKAPSGLEKMAKFLLNDAILSWGVGARGFMYNAMMAKEAYSRGVRVITRIIGPKFVNVHGE